MTFYDGSTSIGTGTLSGGKATLKTTTLPAGSDPITAVYSGDGNFVTSTSTVLNQTVNQDATTAKVTSSAVPVGPSVDAAIGALQDDLSVNDPVNDLAVEQVSADSPGLRRSVSKEPALRRGSLR